MGYDRCSVTTAVWKLWLMFPLPHAKQRMLQSSAPTATPSVSPEGTQDEDKLVAKPSPLAVTLTVHPEGIQDGEKQDAGSRYLKWKAKSVSYSVMSDSATPWAVAHQAPLFIEFSWQEYWSGLPFLSPGDFPDPGIQSGSPALQVDFFLTIWATWESP